MSKSYRASMDANLGVPPDHPGASKRKPAPHKAFVSKSIKTNLGAVKQPSPKAGHPGHSVRTAKGVIRSAK